MEINILGRIQQINRLRGLGRLLRHTRLRRLLRLLLLLLLTHPTITPITATIKHLAVAIIQASIMTPIGDAVPEQRPLRHRTRLGRAVLGPISPRIIPAPATPERIVRPLSILRH